MITKTFICDVCKSSVGENDLIQISSSIIIPKQPNGTIEFYKNRSRTIVSTTKDVCKPCLEKKNLILERSDNNETNILNDASNQKSIETRLIDILEDLGVQFAE